MTLPVRIMLLHPLDNWWCPTAVKDRFFAPVGPDIERERFFRGGYPVRFLILSRGLRAHIQGQRTIGIEFEILVLGAQRITVEIVDLKKVMVIVNGHRPETMDWWQLAIWEGHCVKFLAFQLHALRIVIGIEVLRLGRPVVEHVRSGRAGAHQIVKPPLGIVGGAVPAIAGGNAVVLPLEKRPNHIPLRLHGRFDQGLFDFRVLCGRLRGPGGWWHKGLLHRAMGQPHPSRQGAGRRTVPA